MKEKFDLRQSLSDGFERTHEDTAQATAKLMSIIDASARGLHSAVAQGTAKSVTETRKAKEELAEGQKRLEKKIDKIGKPAAFSGLDWLTVFIVSALGALGGWFFSKAMISHQFAAWVDRKTTTQYIRDAAGNWTDVVQKTTTATVWPTVIVTIIIGALVGLFAAITILDIVKAKEARKNDE